MVRNAADCAPARMVRLLAEDAQALLAIGMSAEHARWVWERRLPRLVRAGRPPTGQEVEFAWSLALGAAGEGMAPPLMEEAP